MQKNCLDAWKRKDVVDREAEKKYGDDHDADAYGVDLEALADGHQQKNGRE